MGIEVMEMFRKLMSSDKQKNEQSDDGYGSEKIKIRRGDEIGITRIDDELLKEKRKDIARWFCRVEKVSSKSFSALVVKPCEKPKIKEHSLVRIEIFRDVFAAKSEVKILKNHTFLGKNKVELEYPNKVKWGVSLRRKHERVKVHINSKAGLGDTGNNKTFYVELVDISEGGLGIISPVQMSKDDVMVIDTLYPSLPDRLKAKVAWVEKSTSAKTDAVEYRVGLELIGVSSEEVEKLKAFCETKKAK
jgi:hypothetical protein